MEFLEPIGIGILRAIGGPIEKLAQNPIVKVGGSIAAAAGGLTAVGLGFAATGYGFQKVADHISGNDYNSMKKLQDEDQQKQMIDMKKQSDDDQRSILKEANLIK